MKCQRILVVGGGLAGCWLSYWLLQRGHELVLASRSLPGESSVVAAGLFHPAPGKRWNLREGFAQEFPTAKKAYRELEALSGKWLWQEQLLRRDLSHSPNARRWSQLKGSADSASLAALEPWIERVESGAVFFHSSGRVDVPEALRVLENFVRNHSQGQCWDALIEDEELGFEAEKICVRGQHFDQVVLCRGWREAHGLGGHHLPWRNAAGEILRLEFDANLPPWIQSAAHWQIPLPDSREVQANQALMGATHRWHEFSSQPQAGGVKLLLQAFQAQTGQVKLVGAQAGVRPIQQARQVLCEQSPRHSRLWVLNSLGSHGALRAPVFAQQLAAKLG